MKSVLFRKTGRLHWRALALVSLACALFLALRETSEQAQNEDLKPLAPIRDANLVPTITHQAPQKAGRLECYNEPAEAPRWTIGYGKEFWRKQQNPSVSQGPHIGEAIERVSHALTPNRVDGAPHVQRANYSAIFDGTGLRFSVPNYDEQPSSAADVFFRTVDVRAGNQCIYAAGSALSPWSVMGNTAQALLHEESGLIEHYETRSDGVAVTWIIRDRLPHGQPFTVSAELSGLEYAGQTEFGHHFADSTGIARVRFGNATIVDSEGNEWDVPVLASANKLTIEVPNDVLSEAAYPLAIDPILSPEFGIDNLFTPVKGDQRVPAIAFNGSVYLVAWSDARDTNTTGLDIYGTRVTPAGSLLDPGGIAISTAPLNQDQPAVASVGGNFLVVWQDSRTQGDNRRDIYGSIVLGGGGVQHPAGITLATGSDDQIDPAVAASATEYMVVWDNGRGFGPFGAPDHQIFGMSVRADGTLPGSVGGAPVSSSGSLDQGHPCVASDGTRFLIAYVDTGRPQGVGIYGVGIGAGLPVEFPIGVGLSGAYGRPALASSGTNYMLVFQHFFTFPDVNIYGRIVTTNFSNGIGMNVAVTGGNQSRPDVASNGREYFVVWQDDRNNQTTLWDIYGTRITGGGRVVTTNGAPITTSYDFEVAPAVAAAGQDFLVVWEDDRNWASTGADIYGTRVSGAGNVLDGNGFVVSAVFGAQLSPAIAFNGSHYLVVWNDYRNGNNTNVWVMGLRLTPNGTPLDPAAIEINMIPGSKQAISVAANGSDFLVVWEDGRNYTTAFGDVYAARVTGGGSVLDPAGIPISTAAIHETACKVAANGTDYLVIWQDPRFGAYNVFGTRVTTSGTVINPSGTLINAGAGNANLPAIASDGSGYFVVWEDIRPGFNKIYGTRVSSTGAPLDSGGLVMSSSNLFQRFPAVAFNGVNYLVCWYDQRPGTTLQDIWGTRVTTAGVVLDVHTNIPISAVSGTQVAPALASFGPNFLVVWEDRRLASTWPDIFAAQVAGGGTVVDPAGLPVNTNPGEQRGAAIAYGGNRTFLVVSHAQQNGVFRIIGNLIKYAPDNPPIPGLYNTGVDNFGVPLADNSIDLHYRLVPPSPVLTAPQVATSAGGFPIPPWLSDSTISAWIAPTGNTFGPGATDGSAIYHYETTFDLNGFDPTTATIIGQWATDNDGLDILINGISTGQGNAAQFVTFTPFQITSGFNGGLNRLTFVLSNGRGEASPNGPTGLRVEMIGSAKPTAQPYIRSIEHNPKGVIITWGSQPGRVYVVLYKNNLADRRWLELSPPIEANGPITSYFDQNPPRQRFYLVVLAK